MNSRNISPSACTAWLYMSVYSEPYGLHMHYDRVKCVTVMHPSATVAVVIPAVLGCGLK